MNNGKLKVLDLFSGIGGFSLGLERAGMHTAAFCEIEEYPKAVLAKHWPQINCYGDVKELTASRLTQDGISIDVICGGFPCQDLSLAGKGAGLAGARSGLWSEFRRLIKEIKPKYAIVENVSALRSRGLGEVLRSLTEIGYDAQWHCIPASAIGAPHKRDRVWIIAYPNSYSEHAVSIHAEMAITPELVSYSKRIKRNARPWEAGTVDEEASNQLGRYCGFWCSESGVDRVAHGIPNRTYRLKGLGNAIVPQIAEIIGKAILTYDRSLVECN